MLIAISLQKRIESLTISSVAVERFSVKYWWGFPLLLLGLLIALFFVTLSTYGFWEILLVLAVLAMAVLTIVSWAFLLANKKWWQFAVSLIATIFIVVVSLLPLGMAAQMGPDSFGKHPIPEGLEYNEPLQEDFDGNYPVVEVDSLDSSTWFQLRGTWIEYSYDFYCSNLPKGDIFIRAYEVTENIPLKVRPGIGDDFYAKIDSVKTFTKIVDNKSFVIEEGDPGDSYAARIEVWHSDAKTGKERKLVEKVYKVEGWSW